MARKELKSLVAKMEALEKRLWGGELPDDAHLPEAQLLKILDLAGRQSFLDGDENREAAPELTEIVNGIIGEQADDKGVQPLLGIRHAAVVQLVENLFRYLEYSSDLDPEAYAALRGLQIPLAKAALVDAAALSSPDKPLLQFLLLSLLACQGCDRNAGFRSKTLLVRLQQAVEEILSSPLSPDRAAQSVHRNFTAYLKQHRRESRDLEPGLIDKEQALTTQQRWQQTIQAEVFGVLAGKRLPKAALEFFPDDPQSVELAALPLA